jgi:hypothetical protein
MGPGSRGPTIGTGSIRLPGERACGWELLQHGRDANHTNYTGDIGTRMMKILNSYYNVSKKWVCRVTIGMIAATAIAFAAAVFDPVSEPIWTAAPFALKSTDLEKGDTKAYRPWFENGAWQGDIIEYDIGSDGNRATNASVGTNPPIAGLTNWTARATFASQEAAVTDYWKAGRKIIMHNGTQQTAFLWSSMSTTERSEIDPVVALDTSKTSAYDSPNLNFVRGDRGSEYPDGLMRKRYSLLGDIVGSHPVYVAAASGLYFSLSDYASYYNDKQNRAGRIYVGANDGLVHVFDAADGREVYAYAPKMVFSKLRHLSAIPYIHKFYANGELVAADARISGAWGTVLAGGLGAGAKGLFAMDISNPDLSSETASTGTNRKLLWEKDGSDSNMGHIYRRPKIAKLPDGNWYVVSGNGYGSTNGLASLILVNIGTGVVSNISTGIGGANGLSAPTLIDTDGDSVADYAYAGDLLGNLWKFTLASPQSAFKLFSAGTSKPITSAPELGRHPYGGNLVFFGTGSLLSETDAGNMDQQSVYAIWDEPGNSSTVTSNSLRSQTLTEATHSSGGKVRIATDNAVDWSTHNGWKLDFPESGERLLGKPQLRGARLQFVSTEQSRNNWLTGLDWLTGGDGKIILFDLSDNNVLDDADMVTVIGSGSSETYTPVATDLGVSNYSQPSIARISDGVDVIYLNGLTLPSELPPTGCTGDCVGGIAGGHMDVDTDVTLGDSTDAHAHEYDDKYDITYADYLDLQEGALQSVDDNPPNIPDTKKMVAILANADFSQGGNLTIGSKTWSVLHYQEMVQSALASWDGVDLATLQDENGDPLAFSLDDLEASQMLRITFNSLTIQQGGLHPTQTGCVKNSLDITNGRWRNGALTMHLLDASLLKAGGAANNIYVAQNPDDLIPGMVGGGLHANPSNSSGFLWESTLFWHFEEYSTLCYGDIGWEEDRDEAFGAPAANTAEDLVGLLTQLLNVHAQLNAYGCAKYDKNGKCKDRDYKDMVKQYNELVGLLFNFSTSSSTVYVPAIPADVLDTAAEYVPSPGPIGKFGRYSWIDFE